MSRSVSVPADAAGVVFFKLDLTGYDEDWVTDELQTVLIRRYPSLRPERRWAGECRILAENDHGCFAIAEYGSIWSLSVVVHGRSGLARQWAMMVTPNLPAIVRQLGLEPLQRIAVASNGEAFYRPCPSSRQPQTA